MTQTAPSSSGLPARSVSRIIPAGPAEPGFAGPGHTAVEVFGPRQIARTDPFVLLMDDRLDFHSGQPIGDAHPHAGLETVTLMLEGTIYDPAFGILEAGDVEWMNAGRGIVHSEGVKATGWARILQLWIALPQALRNSTPDLEIVPLSTLPIRREPGVEARLYSGSTGELTSPTRNRVPVTLVDFTLDPQAAVAQALPGAYSGLLYVVSGSVEFGGQTVSTGQVGWFDPANAAQTELRFRAQAGGARAVLYAGAPIQEPLTQRGPFVAGSQDEITDLYRRFRAGAFERLGEVAARG